MDEGLHLPMRGILTPRTTSGKRLRLRVSPEDYHRIGRGPDWDPVDVTDLDTGHVYRLSPAACSAPRCFCDALAVKRPA